MRLQETVAIRHEREGVGVARHDVHDWLDAWEVPVDHEVVMLLLSEAVTNAVEHGGPPSSIRVRWDDEVLKVSVRDALCGSLPVLHTVGIDAESGRGLALIDALANRWGIDVAAGSKTLWFEVLEQVDGARGTAPGDLTG